MPEVAIMIEGQDGLDWATWQRLARTVEDCGYAGLYRSDHFTNPTGPVLDALELWTSLTWLADNTSRVEFGPLVSPVSFRHPRDHHLAGVGGGQPGRRPPPTGYRRGLAGARARDPRLRAAGDGPPVRPLRGRPRGHHPPPAKRRTRLVRRRVLPAAGRGANAPVPASRRTAHSHRRQRTAAHAPAGRPLRRRVERGPRNPGAVCEVERPPRRDTAGDRAP